MSDSRNKAILEENILELNKRILDHVETRDVPGGQFRKTPSIVGKSNYSEDLNNGPLNGQPSYTTVIKLAKTIKFIIFVYKKTI